MAAHDSPLPLVVFDLDDTLIDTRNVLLPAALRRVADATGIPVADLDATGKKIEEVLRGVAGLSEAKRAAAAAAWYDPDVPPLDPVPGARALLERLRGRVRLCLLTRGEPARQRNKIERSGLGELFDEIVIRAIEQPGSKRDDLVRLLDGRAAARCAVIGDDPRDELHFAEELGCLAIAVPETPLEKIEARLEAAGIL
jgi:FMN phosphatase YigB (HAD superfamily)